MKRAVMAIFATLTLTLSLTMGTSATYATPIVPDEDHGFICPVQELYASVYGQSYMRVGQNRYLEIEAWHRHGELEMVTYKNVDIVALDPSIATVERNSDGGNTVSALSPGTARFIASYGGVSGEFEVDVLN